MLSLASRIMTAPLGQTHLFSLGQAGYVIKSKSGQLLGIDLYLSECVERVEGHIGFKRLLPHILAPFDLVFDFLIATHAHYDHFDMDSMPQLMSNNSTKLFCSITCKDEVERLKMLHNNISYIKPSDKYSCGDFNLSFVNCDHGKGAPDAVGVIITIDGKNILEVGDTCFHADFKNEYLNQGPLDVLIAPINGAYGNLNESECSLLSKLLSPKLTIPCHYGMFASHGGNPGLFLQIMKNECPNNKIAILQLGEKLTL